MKTFVIAGTHAEAKFWIKQDLDKRWDNGETSLTLSHYWIVSNAVNLKGVSNPHGVFVGTWKNRTDILEIVKQLMISSHLGNTALKEIYESIKPTPKASKPFVMIKTRTGTWDIFDTNQLPFAHRIVKTG